MVSFLNLRIEVREYYSISEWINVTILAECEQNKTSKMTYFLTSWSAVLLEQLTDSQLVKTFSLVLWNPKVYYRIHKCPPPVHVISQLERVQTPTSFFLKFHLNIIFPSTPGSPKWCLTPQVSTPKPHIRLSSPHTCYIPRSSHSSRFYHPNNIRWRVQIIQCLITQLPPFPCYLVPPWPKYFPQHPTLKHPQPVFLPQCQRTSFTPIQNNK